MWGQSVAGNLAAGRPAGLAIVAAPAVLSSAAGQLASSAVGAAGWDVGKGRGSTERVLVASGA
jgi:hypothetical protein